MTLKNSRPVPLGLQPATINRRLATLRSLVKFANTLGLVSWTLSVENLPVLPYRDTDGPDRSSAFGLLSPGWWSTNFGSTGSPGRSTTLM